MMREFSDFFPFFQPRVYRPFVRVWGLFLCGIFALSSPIIAQTEIEEALFDSLLKDKFYALEKAQRMDSLLSTFENQSLAQRFKLGRYYYFCGSSIDDEENPERAFCLNKADSVFFACGKEHPNLHMFPLWQGRISEARLGREAKDLAADYYLAAYDLILNHEEPKKFKRDAQTILRFMTAYHFLITEDQEKGLYYQDEMMKWMDGEE